MAEFVLDLDSNPHPRMLAGALKRRRLAARVPGWSDDYSQVHGEWFGYLAAMADATGCDEADLIAWLDRHEANQ